MTTGPALTESVSPGLTARRWGAWWQRANRHGRLTTMVLFLPPALLLFTIFVVVPIGEAGFLGFYKWNGYGEVTKFVGTQNYERLAGNRVFKSALVNTGLVIAVSLLVQLPLALGMALLLANKGPVAYIFRTIFFLPFILAEVATGLIWRFVYDGEFGLVSSIWGALGAEAPFVLAERGLAMYAILVVVVWKFFGFHMMLFIAGLQNIPRELIEAAQIDGASRWKVTFYVVLPLLKPTIMLSMFFAVLGSLQLFDLIMPLTGGGPSNSSHTIVTYLYQFGIVRLRIGYGSAVGVVLFFISLAFALAYRRNLFPKSAG